MLINFLTVFSQFLLKKLKSDIEEIPDSDSVEKTLREYMKKLLAEETDTEEILKDYSTKIDNEIEKVRQIKDTDLKNSTLLSLQKQVDFAKSRLEEHYALVDMIKTITDQNDKVKKLNEDFVQTDEEQLASLEQMKNQIEEMHSTIESLGNQIEEVSNSRPDMKESMIQTEIVSCIAGLIFCIAFQPLAHKCAAAVTAPKAKPEKKKKGRKEQPDGTDDTETPEETSAPEEENPDSEQPETETE